MRWHPCPTAILLVVASVLAVESSSASSGIQNSCEDWAGKRDIKDYRACVAIEETGRGRTAMSWKWRWPYGPDVVAYPEIMFGRNPWRDASTTPGLPVQVGRCKPLVKYQADLKASGTYNLAFDLWITRTVTAREADITHEIMIWVANSGGIPDGAKEAVVRIGGMEYDLWVKKDHGVARWTYAAFVSRGEQLKATLDLGAFMSILVERGLLATDLYLSSVEFGNEITGGEGACAITGYDIAIRGR